MKRFIALVLSLVMALSLCAPAWATMPAEGETVTVANADQLVEALEAGKSVVFANDITIDPANMSNAYGTTGINVKQGQTIDGGNFTLDIKGAGGTWDSGINTTGGTIKNITITGSFRGIFINHNSEYKAKVILENVTTTGTTYTISCDQGTNNGLEATNCSFYGWTSFAATLGDATFTNCHFGEGSGYAFMRPYAPAKFVGCSFEAGYEMDPRAAVTFKNCTLGDALITNNNLATLVTSNSANASVVTAEVSFNANNGTGEMESVTLASGETYTLPECGFTAPEGKQFKGWATVMDAVDALGTSYTVTDNVTFYAIWKDIPTDAPVIEDIGEVGIGEAAPEVSVEVNTENMTNEQAQAVTNTVNNLQAEGAVESTGEGLTSAAEEIAAAVKEENEVVITDTHVGALDDILTGAVVADDVVVAVQTYLDIKVADVEFVDESSDVQTVTLNITPMYQLVATTEDVLNSDAELDTNHEDGEANAIALGEAKKMTVTEPVVITVTLPEFARQTVYILHEAANGDVIYEATADANGQLTFTTKSGFSPFTFSLNAFDVGAKVEGGDSYADLQSALNYMGKDAVVTVMVEDQQAEVSGEVSFTVKFENGATKDNTKITAADGYYLVTKNVEGGVQYTVKKNPTYVGGYIPTTPSTDDDKPIKSADTFDAGIALYAAVSVMGAMGAVVLGKKRED